MKRFFLSILALILPPVAVFAKAGIGGQLFLNIFFCLLFWIPAPIHAFWFIQRQYRKVEEAFMDPEEFNGLPSYGQDGRSEPKLS